MSFVRMNKKVLRPATSSLQCPAPNTSTTTSQNPSTSSAAPAPTPAKEQSSRGPVVSFVGSIIRVSKSASQATSAVGVSATNIPGTRAWVNGQILTSTGLPQWDAVIGGGLPLGSVVTMVPDNLTSFHKEFSKAFASEGMVHGHTIVVALPETVQACETFVQNVRVSNRRLAAAAIQAKTLKGNTSVNITGVDSSIIDVSEDPEKDIFEEDEHVQTVSAGADGTDNSDALTTGAVKAAMRGEGVSAQSKLKIAWRYEAYSNALDAGGNLSGSGSVASLYEPAHANTTSTSDTDARAAADAGTGGAAASSSAPASLSTTSDVFCLSTLAANTVPTPAAHEDDFAAIFRTATHPPSTSNATSTPTPTSTGGVVSACSPLRAHFTAILTQLATVIQRAHAFHHVAFVKQQQQQHASGSASSSPSSPSRPAAAVCRVLLDCLNPRSWPSIATTHTQAHAHGGRGGGDALPLDGSSTSEVLRFIHALRGLCHSSNTVVYVVTPPTHLISPSLLASLHRLSDVSLNIQSFTDSFTPSTYASAFGDFDGMMTLFKLPRPNSPHYTFPLPDTLQYLFKLRNKTLDLQRLALPPETSRTPAAPTVTHSGGAFDAYLESGISSFDAKSNSGNAETNVTGSNTGAEKTQMSKELPESKLGKGVGSINPESSNFKSSGKILPVAIRSRPHTTLAVGRGMGIDSGIDIIAEEGEEEEDAEEGSGEGHSRDTEEQMRVQRDRVRVGKQEAQGGERVKRGATVAGVVDGSATNISAREAVMQGDAPGGRGLAREGARTHTEGRGLVLAGFAGEAAAGAEDVDVGVEVAVAVPAPVGAGAGRGVRARMRERVRAREREREINNLREEVVVANGDNATSATGASDKDGKASLFDCTDEEIVAMFGIIGNPEDNSESEEEEEIIFRNVHSSTTSYSGQASTDEAAFPLARSEFDMLTSTTTVESSPEIFDAMYRRDVTHNMNKDAMYEEDAGEHVDELEEEAEKEAAERVGETSGCGTSSSKKNVFEKSNGGIEDMF